MAYPTGCVFRSVQAESDQRHLTVGNRHTRARRGTGCGETARRLDIQIVFIQAIQTPWSADLYGSWPQMGSPAGFLLATAVFAIVSTLPVADFETWGWRIRSCSARR
jgi:hypothetical protein